jgi:hypothetical protein
MDRRERSGGSPFVGVFVDGRVALIVHVPENDVRYITT